MPLVKMLKRGKKSYYYLEHSIRDGRRVYKKRFYLGTNVPRNIGLLKEKLIDKIYQDRWYGKFEEIRKNCSSTLKRTPKTVIEKNLEGFMVRFTYDTQRIEGSTLTLSDTTKILLDRVTPNNAPLNDVKEAEKHKLVFYEILRHKGTLTLDLVLKWHKELFEETKKDVAGKIRTYPVLIGASNFIPPNYKKLDDMLSNFFEWYQSNENEINPVKLSALVHLDFVTIHPFGDGNGRMSRLLMNFVLNKFKYPMIDIKYSNRQAYYNALQRAQVLKDRNIFIEWFFRRYLEENKGYLERHTYQRHKHATKN